MSDGILKPDGWDTPVKIAYKKISVMAAYLFDQQYFLGLVKIAISFVNVWGSASVAFGLIWLQYELAVPLAMIFIMLIMFFPSF